MSMRMRKLNVYLAARFSRKNKKKCLQCILMNHLSLAVDIFLNTYVKLYVKLTVVILSFTFTNNI